MRRLLHWLTYGHSVTAKPGVGEVHVTYRRWSGRITDVVVRPEGHEPLQLRPLSPATVQYLALSRAAETLRQRALQVQVDRWLIDALAEFAVDASAPSLVEGWQGWGGRGAGVRGPAPHQLPPGGGHRPGGA